jgi:hypothetical protein
LSKNVEAIVQINLFINKFDECEKTFNNAYYFMNKSKKINIRLAANGGLFCYVPS